MIRKYLFQSLRAAFLIAFLFPTGRLRAQETQPDTARIGAYLDNLYRSNQDSINVPAYRKRGIRLSDTALIIATRHRSRMPDRFLDAWEMRARYMFNYMGKRDSASRMFDSLLVWYEQAKRFDIKYAQALNQKSRVYFHNGMYVGMDSLLQRSLKIFRESGDTLSPQYASVCKSYGQMLINLNRPAEAKKILAQSLQIVRQSGTRRSYMSYLNDWGETLGRLGEPGQAEQAFLEVRRVLDSLDRPGKLDPMYFAAGVNLSKLYFKQGKFKVGEALLLNDLTRNSDTLSTTFSAALTNLAGACFDRKKYAEARAYYHRSLAQRKKMFPPTHKQVLRQEFLLAMLNYADQRPAEVREALARCLPRWIQDLSDNADYFTEKEMLATQAAYIHEYAIACSFAWDFPDEPMAGLLYDWVLASKTALLDKTLRIRAAVQRGDPALKKYWADWVALKKEIDNAVQYNDSTAELEKELNRLEKEMSIWESRDNQLARQKVTWENVREALKAGETAIEFIRFPYRNPFETDSVYYAALVLRKDYPAPRLVRLFEAAELKRLLGEVDPGEPSSFSLPYRSASSGLGKLIWTDKLDRHVARGQAVYYSMDGDLARINPAAIALGKTGESLFDYCGPMIDVSSTRELALQQQYGQPTATYPGSDDYILIFGGIEYRVAGDAKIPAGDIICTYLPGTQTEAEFLDSLCRALGDSSALKLGPSARESVLSAAGSGLNSPWLLHLGTHGFFYEKKPKPGAGDPYFISNADPLRRGGLLLANSCTNWGLNPASGGPPESENGIFFSFEAARLDFSQTYLTVIPACWSGAAESLGFEGQFGLRRGFRVAGSDYLLLSLWNTNDTASVLFMQDFYHALLARKKDVHTAFWEAVKKQRLRPEFREPYYWANFILIGPPRRR